MRPGLVSVNDVTRAELEYATAEMGATQTQGEVETAYLQLGYLLDTVIDGKLALPELLLAQAEQPAAAGADAASRRPGAASRPARPGLARQGPAGAGPGAQPRVAAQPEPDLPVPLHQRGGADRQVHHLVGRPGP